MARAEDVFGIAVGQSIIICIIGGVSVARVCIAPFMMVCHVLELPFSKAQFSVVFPRSYPHMKRYLVRGRKNTHHLTFEVILCMMR